MELAVYVFGDVSVIVCVVRVWLFCEDRIVGGTDRKIKQTTKNLEMQSIQSTF